MSQIFTRNTSKSWKVDVFRFTYYSETSSSIRSRQENHQWKIMRLMIFQIILNKISELSGKCFNQQRPKKSGLPLRYNEGTSYFTQNQLFNYSYKLTGVTTNKGMRILSRRSIIRLLGFASLSSENTLPELWNIISN